MKYNGAGRRTGWSQTDGPGDPITTMHAELNRSDEVTSFEKYQGATLKRAEAFRYDKAGNRIGYRIDAGVGSSLQARKTTLYPDKLNQIQQVVAPDKVYLKGTVSEPATVTVDGTLVPTGPIPAGPTPSQQFYFDDSISGASYSGTIQARDFGAGSGNLTTKNYSGSAGPVALQGHSYDLNGNTETAIGTVYTWDGEDRLVKIVKGTQTTEITYDGFSRWARIVQKTGATVDSDERFIWLGGRLLAVMNSSGVVTKRYFAQGYQTAFGTQSRLAFGDIRGNVRETRDLNGTLAGRFDFDLFGARTRTAGTEDSDYGFGGLYHLPNSGPLLATFRAYQPEHGKWLSRDPIGEAGGLNLYGFVGNDPVNYVDPIGLDYYAVPPLWSGSSEIPYYYGDTVWEDLSAVTYNVGAALVNTVEGIGAFADWAGEKVFGQANAEAASIFLGTRCNLGRLGRLGKQARLRELVNDANISSADREWIQHEINSIGRGKRTTIRVPPGKNLAHQRDLPAKKGNGYKHSYLQDIDLHKLQHKHEGY